MAVVLFKRSRDESHLFAVRDRQKVEGATVQFEFKSREQYERFSRLTRKHVYPLLSSAPFRELATFIFGKDAVKKISIGDSGREERANLSREHFEKLADPAFVARKIRQAHRQGLLRQDPADTYAAEVSKVARFILNTQDKHGVSVFDLFDKSARGHVRAPASDGRVLSEDVQDFVIDTFLFKGNF